MQPTLPKLYEIRSRDLTGVVSDTPRSITFPGLNRANNVPHWQRLHQSHEDGLRQWQKVDPSPSPHTDQNAWRAGAAEERSA